MDPCILTTTAPLGWHLRLASSSYLIAVADDGTLANVHWGGRLADADQVAILGAETEEFPGCGGLRFAEPALKTVTAAGVRDCVLVYARHEQRGADHLVITLREKADPFEVELHYRLYPDLDIISRWARLTNLGTADLTVESFQSAVLRLPPGTAYGLTHLASRWGGETQVVRERLDRGKKVLESRRGGSTGLDALPSVFLDRDGAADETSGEVWFASLAWSGNWRIAVDQRHARSYPEYRHSAETRVVAGMNDFDFTQALAPGATLEAPALYFGRTAAGFGDASHRLHRLQLDHLAPRPTASLPRPVIYNSWYATVYEVTVDGQSELARQAAALGVELFVVDDGWFGGREDDHAGLGDWFPSRRKFPDGLRPLIDRVQALGMRFGLWIEPEMVNPDSDLFRAHPDWIMRFPGRDSTLRRNQLVLNFARPEVVAHMLEAVSALLTEGVSYLKWDMNRPFTEPGWPEMRQVEQRTLWQRHTTNIYGMIDELRRRHPGVEIESCSGGGGRVDLAMAQRSEQFWTSDNTDGFDRLSIQEGFSFVHPARTMMGFVTDVPDLLSKRTVSLPYRFLSTMQGVLCLGVNLPRWSDDDRAIATRFIAEYKRIRDVIHHGGLHRLHSPRSGSGLCANAYVAGDRRRAVAFVFLHSRAGAAPLPAVRLRGLDPDGRYACRLIHGTGAADGMTRSGAYWMEIGLALNLIGDFDCALAEFTAT